MYLRYKNFKANIEQRKKKISELLDYDYLFSIVESKYIKDESVPYQWLRPNDQIRAVNNSLILATTDDILEIPTVQELQDAILNECLVSGYNFITTMVFTND